MTTVELVLTILLAVGFLTLIIMSIVLVSLLLAIMKRLNRIAAKAETATNNVAGIAESLGRKLAPIAASGIMGLIMKKFAGKKREK